MCQLCDIAFVGFAEPQEAMLDGFKDALQRGWSPHTERDVCATILSALEADAAGYLATQLDKQAPDQTVTLDDGRCVPKLAQRVRWVWDGDFCGSINLRFQPGTTALPDHVLGHVGYAIVPWKRGHGLAKRALRHMLSEARDAGLAHMDVCTTADNPASQKVITANGGTLVETFVWKPADPTVRQRYRILL